MQFDEHEITNAMRKAGEDHHCLFCVRAFIWQKATGKKVPAGSRLEQTCRDFNCVNPAHAKLVNLDH